MLAESPKYQYSRGETIKITIGYVALYIILSVCATEVISWTSWFQSKENNNYLSLFSTVFAICTFLFTVVTTIVNLLHSKKTEHETTEALKRIMHHIASNEQEQPDSTPNPRAESQAPVAPCLLYICINWLFPVIVLLLKRFHCCPCPLKGVIAFWVVWAFLCSIQLKGVIYAYEITWLYKKAVEYHYVLLSFLIVAAFASAICFIPRAI